MLDPTADPRTRAHVAFALGVAAFILGQVEEFGEPLEDFEKVFSGSYKGGAKHSPETLAMHTSALASWTLLMSMMSPMKCYKTLERYEGSNLRRITNRKGTQSRARLYDPRRFTCTCIWPILG